METKTYDAFISYRHSDQGKEIARKLQNMLETYKPPRNLLKSRDKRRIEVFRDESDLSNSPSLRASLLKELSNSKFLIVLLTPDYQNSEWCMEEIRAFKEKHGGRIDHILLVLLSGEPKESIPEVLRYNTCELQKTDDNITVKDVPLYCDIRSDSLSGSKHKLKTEYLRLLARILDCNFDDLYQRDMRRRRMRIAALVSIITVISAFAYKTNIAEQNEKNNLIDTYVKQGVSQIEEGNASKALMYYANALMLDKQTQSARTGVLLLLQQYGWLNYVDSQPGNLVFGQVRRGAHTSGSSLISINGKHLLPDDSFNSIRDGFKFGLLCDGFKVVDDTGNTIDKLDISGTMFNCSNDGNCWIFKTESSIVFYFPADGRRFDIVLPQKSSDGVFANAMVIGDTRAVLVFENKMYLYDIDFTKGSYKETSAFDLESIFLSDKEVWTDEIMRIRSLHLPNSVPGNNLVDNPDGDELVDNPVVSKISNVWFDSDGRLAIVKKGPTAAVFDVINGTLNKLHSYAGRMLNTVAFSGNGGHYALVYGGTLGQANMVGGCIEVYSQDGELCMRTPFDDNVIFNNAAFSCDGKNIAAWGNGELYIWDISTGIKNVAGLSLNQAKSVCWSEDNKLLIGDGKGSISTYEIVRYSPRIQEGDVISSFKRADYLTEEVELDNGYIFSRSTSDFCVKNAEGNIIVKRRFSNPNEDADLSGAFSDQKKTNNIDLVNRMYKDDARSSVYLWSSLINCDMLAVKLGKDGKLVSTCVLNMGGKKPYAVYAIWNGVLIEMDNGELMYFKDGQARCSTILKPNTRGKITEIVENGNGLLSFIIEHQDHTEGMSFDHLYSVEIWDLNKAVMLAEPVYMSKDEPANLCYSKNNFLCYTISDQRTPLLLDSTAVDTTLIETLQRMSCYSMDKDQNARVQTVSFNSSALGTWSTLLTANQEIQKVTPTPDQIVIDKMENVFTHEGKTAWLETFDDWWLSSEPEKMALSDLIKIFENYVDKGISNDCANVLTKGVKVFFDRVATEKGIFEFVFELKLSTTIIKLSFYSNSYVNDIITYHANRAKFYEDAYSNGAGEEILLYGFMERAQVRFLQGMGKNAYNLRDLSPYSDFGMDVFIEICRQLDPKLTILEGDIKKAAEIYDQNNNTANMTFLWLMELGSYVNLGLISESDYSLFIKSLGSSVGLKILQVTAEQWDIGIRPGDKLVAVDGIYFGTTPYLRRLQSSHPNARLTIERDGKSFTTDVIDHWQVCGEYSK